MTNTAKAASLLVLSTLSLATAAAQNQTKVDVPFAFRVGSTTLPAGTYTIIIDPGKQTITISQWSTKTSLQTMGMHDGYSESTPNTLIFHRVANKYFLHEVVRGESSSAVKLPITREELMAKHEMERAGLVPLDPVLLAMN